MASSSAGTPETISAKRRRRGLYLGVAAILIVAAAGALAFTNLGFGFDSVHITEVDLVFAGGSCPGWNNATTTGISGNAGSQVSIPVPLTDESRSGSCVAENVSAGPSEFSIVSTNAPLTVDAGATQTLEVTVGLPQSSYSGGLTILVWISPGT